MNLDFSQFSSEYESLVAQVDAVFQKVSGNFAAEVKSPLRFQRGMLAQHLLDDQLLQFSAPYGAAN